MTRSVEVKEGQSFQDRTGLAVRVQRIDANNRIHFSVIDYYREGTEKLRKTKVGNIPSRSGVNSCYSNASRAAPSGILCQKGSVFGLRTRRHAPRVADKQ